MRYCPSIGLGLGLSLRSQGFGVSYVKTNRVLDLANLGAYTIVDQSPEGNDATLYTGRFVSTNGSSDKAISANCSAAGSGNYYLTGKIKPVSTSAWVSIGGSASNVTGLSAGVWQDFTSGTQTGVTPSGVIIGNNGSTSYSAASWSDVKLINAATGATVARWQLNDSSAGNLGGYPALDSSGNGYHGAHVGCAGGTGATTILQTAGLDWNKYSRFNGTNTVAAASSVGVSSIDFDQTDSFEIELSFLEFVGTPTAFRRILSFDGDTGRYDVILGSQSGSGLDSGVSFGVGTDNYWTTAGGVFDQGVVNSLKITVTAGTPTLEVNGSPVTIAASGLNWTGSNNSKLNVGAKNNSGYTQLFNGVISSVSINNSSSVSLLNYTGLGNDPWKDTIGTNDGTESGTFTRILAPSDDTTPANDALGTVIVNPRVNNSVLNLFGDGEYALVPAAASLDTAKTVSGWVYYGGVAATFLDLGTPTISSSGGSLTSSGFTAPTYHVNGVSTATLGAAGWKHVMVTSTAALATDNWDQLLIPQAKLIGYSDVKVTADALQNYNAQKAAFGL